MSPKSIRVGEFLVRVKGEVWGGFVYVCGEEFCNSRPEYHGDDDYHQGTGPSDAWEFHEWRPWFLPWRKSVSDAVSAAVAWAREMTAHREKSRQNQAIAEEIADEVRELVAEIANG